MSVGIECPVCEAVFRVKQVSSKTGIRCPKCDRKFRYSEEILAVPQPAKKASVLTDTKPTKSKTKNHTTREPSSANSVPAENQQPKPISASTANQPSQDNRKSNPAAGESELANDPHATKVKSPSHRLG